MSDRPPRPEALVRLELATALAYREHCAGRPSSDPLTVTVQEANEAEITRLEADLVEDMCPARRPHILTVLSDEGDGGDISVELACLYEPDDPARPCIGVDCPVHEDESNSLCLVRCPGAVSIDGCMYREYKDMGGAVISGLELAIPVTGCWDGYACVLIPSPDPRNEVVAAARALRSSAEECDGWDRLQAALEHLDAVIEPCNGACDYSRTGGVCDVCGREAS